MDFDKLLPAGGLEALASQLGISTAQARQGAEGLLPSIVGGFAQRAGGPQAPQADALGEHLTQLGGQALADSVTGSQPADVDKGNELLGHIFASKDVSRQVAGRAAQSTGLAPELLKKMLPVLTMLVAGYMAKQSSAQGGGGLGGVLGSMLGAAGGSDSGGLVGALGSILAGAR